jgi:hypothetical protein
MVMIGHETVSMNLEREKPLRLQKIPHYVNTLLM